MVIREVDYGDAWPFTVPQGELRCIQGDRVVFTAGDISYAVNGLAVSAGYAPIEPIWRPDLPMIRTLAKAFDMTVPESMENETLVRVSIGPVIDAGLALCD